MSRVALTREPVGKRAALAADRFGANDAAPLPNANAPKPVGAADAAGGCEDCMNCADKESKL